MKTKSVIIIGAGLGGIAAAINLAKRGMQVTVLEKNQQAGGRCGRYSRDGHQFDTGPTLMVMPLLLEAEFATLGASMREMLEPRRVDPTYHLIFDDGNRLSLTSDMESMCTQLEALEPGSFQGLLRYMEEGDRHYHVAIRKLLNKDFRRATDFFTLDKVPLLFQVKPLTPHYGHMSTYFDDPRLKAAFTFQDMYMGLSPFEAPATFSMMQYTELAHGVWYPKGGMYRIVEALMELAHQAGVAFEFETTVVRIETSDNAARGVALADGRFLTADVVIADADLPYVYKELLPQDGTAERLERKRFSCSTINFFWGMDKPYPMLGPHTLFVGDSEYREHFDSVVKGSSCAGHPNLYVHAPARLDPSMAPAGQDTLIAIVPVSHMRDDVEQDWGSIQARARQGALDRLATLGITDIDAHIKFELTYTPLSWHKHYNLMNGSTHGLCHNLLQLAYFRPHNRHARYHNLYFVGASTHPGTGIPNALVSARLAAQRVMDDVEP
ncbi:MAG TPA: phytoene desaturase family protein [Longilinea sp.]|nr:phytoene desaturase family protein [Longilinea sp.]